MFNYYNINRDTGKNHYAYDSKHVVKESHKSPEPWCKIDTAGNVVHLDIDAAKKLAKAPVDCFVALALAAYNQGRKDALNEVQMKVFDLQYPKEFQ